MQKFILGRLPVHRATHSITQRIFKSAIIVFSIGILASGIVIYSHKKAAVNRTLIVGRLSQMMNALCAYEAEHGTLPPLCMRNEMGAPIQSWRALILPYLGFSDLPNQLDLSQSWNSEFNRSLTDSVPPGDWVWFTKNRPSTTPISTNILAYVGRLSIWDEKTGLPKGNLSEHQGAIVLLWVPDSNLHPMQPGDITEDEVHERVEKGQEILFVAAHNMTGKHGIVTIDRGQLEFHTK
jgi:hypothetical protein